jgi:antitoxin HicB
MTYNEFRRWLLRQGATITPRKGSHFKVAIGERSTIFPFHGFTMLTYPVTLSPDSNGTLLVGFPDIPYANSVGDDREEGLANALEALEAAIEIYVDNGEPVPLPRANFETGDAVSLPGLASGKVVLWNDMRTQHMGKAELAKLMNVQASLVDKLFKLSDTSSQDLLEAAARHLRERAALRSA